MSHDAIVRLAAMLLVAASVSVPAFAQGPWHEGFESEQVTWRRVDADAHFRVLQHQRVREGAHSGGGCEWLSLEAENGSFIYFGHDVGRPRVCDELAPSVWVKSDRAGLQLAARIVLPRTADPRTGQPVVTIIAGPSYSDVGRWQLLRLDSLVRLLTRQLRVLRLEIGPQVDGKEAYLEAVLLNVYGGPGATNVWIDDLDVAGYVVVNGPTKDTVPSPGQGAAGWNAKGAITPNAGAGQTPSYADTGAGSNSGGGVMSAVPSQKRRAARLIGSVLVVDSHPMLPRIVQHRGESLETLKRLGFNTVWMERLPALEVLMEANRLGMWLVCPPPRPAFVDARENALASDPRNGILPPVPLAEIGPQFDCVLAWNLGSDLDPTKLEATRQWADQVRSADRNNQRPLICRPTSDLRGFSRLAIADLLLIDRRPLGTSLDFADYGEWLRKQPLLARSGTSIWSTVQTQPSEALRQQLTALEPGIATPLCVSPEQIRLLVYTAITSGSRGLLFLSDTPLDAPDPETRQRAMTLELLNLELELMEPWAAAGSFVTAAESKKPEVTGSMIRTEHAHLLLPMWSATGAQYVPPQAATNGLKLVAPGVPDEYEAYEITPSGLQRMNRLRVTGGIEVTLDEFGLTDQILLARRDSGVIGEVQRRARQIGQRTTELHRQLAIRKLSTVESTVQLLPPRRHIAQSAAWFESARQSLKWSNTQAPAGDLLKATLHAERATRALRLIERSYWEAATKGLASPVTSPGAVSFDTLPMHWRFLDRIRASRFGPTLLPGGDFENLDGMLRSGWQHIARQVPGVHSAADIVPDAMHSGVLGLRLAAAPDDPEQPPRVIELAPVMFVTPAIPVEAGQVVCIHGWVNVPTSISCNVDGLLIIDSLAGEPLASRIQRTNGWQEFAMYRAVPQSGTMSVIFALCGLGEARIDDVAIQILHRSADVTQR